MTRAILGIDPGTRKCGYALAVPGRAPLALGIAATAELSAALAEAVRGTAIVAIALGSGTHSAEVAAALAHLGAGLELVDERETTLLARARYFAANPPRGWRRLVPAGMLLPPRPIDDFAALLIAERSRAFAALAREAPAGP